MSDAPLVGVAHPLPGCAVVTLDRPRARNAMSLALRRELVVAFDRLRADPAVRVVVLTGAGDAFCAGLDLKELGAARDPATALVSAEDIDPVLAMARFDRPIIGAINGPAITGGFELALACDLRVAACEAKLGLPEANLGLVPAAGGTQRLTRLAGAGIAKRLILGAEVVDGGQAERLGLVQWARPRAELAAWTRALAQRIAALPREALAANKACIGAAGSPTRDGYADEIAATRALYDSEETRERVARFLAARSTHTKEER